jgi:mannitol operon repressor
MDELPEKRIVSAIGHTRPEVPPHLKNFVGFLDEFNKETARGAALTAAAFLDDLLEKVVVAFLIDNESTASLTSGFNAPLGTLSARMAVCHSLGLISDAEAKECQLVRRIRNEFAHKVHVSFKDDRIRDLCAQLTMSISGEREPRTQFTTAAVALIANLTNRAVHVGSKRCTYGAWPY